MLTLISVQPIEAVKNTLKSGHTSPFLEPTSGDAKNPKHSWAHRNTFFSPISFQERRPVPFQFRLYYIYSF